MDLWGKALAALIALGRHYGPAMDKVAEAAGIHRGLWGMLVAALSFEPETISNEKLQIRVPYQVYTSQLRKLAGQELLELVGDREYRLTDRGGEVAQKVILTAYARMESLEPMRESQLGYLVVLLRRLVAASMLAPEPPGKWSINHSRRFDPGENASLLTQVDQYLSDLGAYRDDAHLAAWQPLGYAPPTWETLTLIWRGEAEDLDSLRQNLSHRQQPAQVYEDALHTLEEKGLVRSQHGKMRITSEGKRIRQEVENTTDEYFYAPWDVLIAEELRALGELLDNLTEGLEKI
jgi:Mn-dependent DtxR family transcriptional regulator